MNHVFIATLFLIVIGVFAVFQFMRTPDIRRIVISAVVASTYALIYFLPVELSGLTSYLLGMVVDIAIVFMVCVYSSHTKFSDGIVWISAISFVLNVVGFGRFEAGMESTIYSYLTYALYSFLVFVLLRKDTADELADIRRTNSINLFKRSHGCRHHRLPGEQEG